MKKAVFVFAIIFLLTGRAFAQSFSIIPLGVHGGIEENNLSAYLAAPFGTKNFVSLDAGTLHAGLEKAIGTMALPGPPDSVLKKNIKGYLISHPHMDHLAGLVINSPDDSPKPIYARPFCLDVFKTHYFSWKSWANFANEGEKPALGKYTYVALGATAETELKNTGMQVKAYPLSHTGAGLSSAFLVRSKEDYLLYLGDTGADSIEKTKELSQLWQAVAPLIKSKKLKGIFIETSYPDEQPESKLFGHLTPKLLMAELQKLAVFTGKNMLKDLPVIITHIKPAGDNEQKIRAQLAMQNALGVKLFFPEQGRSFNL
ncbi:MAG: 3',5'-cyclic-nucleotide phosphodiesterase [Mucilaginibacter polytrichastri]|nr:3',5'-cyclic-nucleotide phosphodiesterase [Mucilaginibacter polytrichastri]